MWAWARKNGWNAPAEHWSRRQINKELREQKKPWNHRVSSSSSGLPKNPPTSAPTNGMPATPMDKIIGTEIFKCDHSALLSPVHTAPSRCELASFVQKQKVSVNKTLSNSPSIDTARENKRTKVWSGSDEAVVRGHVIVEAIEVVPLAMLDVGQIHHSLPHGHLWPVED